MAVAAKLLVLKDFGPSANFANNFKKLKNIGNIALINGDNWFCLDVGIDGYEMAYLYLTHDIQVDLDLEIYRSACYIGLDTAYAVKIPGGDQTWIKAPIVGDVTATDFNISVYGGDKLWFKVIAAGLPAGSFLKDVCVMIKRN